MEEKNVEFTLRDLLDIIVPKLWLVCIVAILFGAVSYFYNTFYVSDSYSSSLQFYLYTTEDENEQISSDSQTITIVCSKAYKSDVFINNLKENLAKEYPAYANVSASALKSMITISLDSKVSVFDVVVTSGDPVLSHAVAQCILDLSYSADPTVKPLIMALVPHTAHLLLYKAPAQATAPNSRNIMRNVALAAIVGAFITVCAVIGISLLDVIVRDKKKLENSLTVPVLGVIPKYESLTKMEVRNYE
ncbi:MAG: hypothetical protein IKV20_01155 [Clostridia bacterium]|nr:hypothetical protein [Clostridia bacterium]